MKKIKNTPWKCGRNSFQIYDNEGNHIADMHLPLARTKEEENLVIERAWMILDAVNNYDALLEKLEIKNPLTRDAGATLLEVALFLLVFAAIMASLGTFGLIARQALEHLQSIGACIQALLECRNI